MYDIVVYMDGSLSLFFSLGTPVHFQNFRDEYGDVEGTNNQEQEYNMMAEIYHRGPIACGIAVTDDLYLNYTGGVYYDKTNDTNIVHDISVVGLVIKQGMSNTKHYILYFLDTDMIKHQDGICKYYSYIR